MSLVLCSMFRSCYSSSGRCNLDLGNSMAHLNTHSVSMLHRSAQKYNFLLKYCSVSTNSLRKGCNVIQVATFQRGLAAQRSPLKDIRLSTRNDRGRRYVIDPLAILRSFARSGVKNWRLLERSILLQSSVGVQRLNSSPAGPVYDLQEIREGASKIPRGAYKIERFSQC
jgi:hypothetical protein